MWIIVKTAPLSITVQSARIPILPLAEPISNVPLAIAWTAHPPMSAEVANTAILSFKVTASNVMYPVAKLLVQVTIIAIHVIIQ